MRVNSCPQLNSVAKFMKKDIRFQFSEKTQYKIRVFKTYILSL